MSNPYRVDLARDSIGLVSWYMGGAIGPREHTICHIKAMTEPETQTSSNPVTENTPAERDESLEPVDFLTTDQDQLLFYLSGKVPIPIQELATKTVHSAGELRKLAGEEFGETVYIDTSDTVRLTDDAQSQVLRASKVFAERGWNKFDTGRTSFEDDSFFDAISQLLRAQAHFEQLGTRFAAIDITSAVLEERIEDTQNYLEKTRGEIGSLSKLVEPGSVGNGEDAEAESSQQSSSVKDADGPREAMLRVVKDRYRELERIPKTTELPEDCEFTPNDFYSEFGNWDDTLEAAGIDKEQELLDEIQRVKQKLGRVPNSADMGEYGAYSGANYSSYFGSWSTALERCELKQDRDETLLETLRSLEERLDRLPKPSDVRDDSDFSQSEYIQIFGSFAEALEAAGIDKQQYLIENLKQVAAKIDGKPGSTAPNKYGDYSSGMYQRYFESWDAAVEAAGLSSTNPATETEREPENESGDVPGTPSTPIGEVTAHIDSVGPATISLFKDAGYTTLGDLHGVEPSEVAKDKEIGIRKATKLIRFVNTNVSSGRVSSGRSSNAGLNGSRSSSSGQTTRPNRLQASVFDNSWETISENEQIDGQFLVQIINTEESTGSVVATRLDVCDQDGREFKMVIRSVHEINQEWIEGEWFALEGVYKKKWISIDGTVKYRLTSTEDFAVVELGPDFDPTAASVEDRSDTDSQSLQPGATTSEAASGSCGGCSTSDAEDAVGTHENPTQSELWEQFHRVAEQLGHLPDYKEFDNMSGYSGGYLTSRVGTWDEVKESYRNWATETGKDLAPTESKLEQEGEAPGPDSGEPVNGPEKTIPGEDVNSVDWETTGDLSTNSNANGVDTSNFADLTAFERDILFVANGLEEPKGREIKQELDSYYDNPVNHGRLYPSLDSLDEAGLIDKSAMNARSNRYTLTDAGVAHLRARQEWKTSAIDTQLTRADEPKAAGNEEPLEDVDTAQSTAGDSDTQPDDDDSDSGGILGEITDEFEDL